MSNFNEAPLADDHPVYWDYLYVCDGKVIRSDVRGNILTLKLDLRTFGHEAKEITNCDIEGRREAYYKNQNKC